MIWNNIETLERIARFIPYIFIILGFFVAFSGQFFQSKIEHRITHLNSQAEEIRKQTCPLLDTHLAISDKGNYLVVIESLNLIPFKARWLIATEENKVVSGVMLGEQEIYPTQKNKKWQFKTDIDKNTVRNDYVELRLNYISVYAAELNYPSNLKGRIVKKYKLIEGAPHLQD